MTADNRSELAMFTRATTNLIRVKVSGIPTIRTRYTGGTYVTAYVLPRDGRSKRHAYDHALSTEENHAAAAELLAVELGWTGTLVGGQSGRREYTFALLPEGLDR